MVWRNPDMDSTHAHTLECCCNEYNPQVGLTKNYQCYFTRHRSSTSFLNSCNHNPFPNDKF